MKPRRPPRNYSVALSLVAAALGMVMLAYASVPLYRLFCQASGFGGTTRRAQTAPLTAEERVITVRFDAQTAPGLPWEFKPGEQEIAVHVGEQRLTYYTAKNLTRHAVTGHAVYNVLPHSAGLYFDKIQCFCFTDQTLAPGQEVRMPVSFFIDPAIMNDPELDEVRTITLSYTFFPATSK